MLSGITDALKTALKISLIVAICSALMGVITTFIQAIQMFVFGDIVGEVLSVISCCLPFNAYAVFGAIFNATTLILSLLVARKIFDLTSWSINSI